MGAEEVKNTKKITKKQKAVLDFIEQQIDETGIALRFVIFATG